MWIGWGPLRHIDPRECAREHLQLGKAEGLYFISLRKFSAQMRSDRSITRSAKKCLTLRQRDMNITGIMLFCKPKAHDGSSTFYADHKFVGGLTSRWMKKFRECTLADATECQCWVLSLGRSDRRTATIDHLRKGAVFPWPWYLHHCQIGRRSMRAKSPSHNLLNCKG